MITAAKAKYLANGQLSEVDNYLKKYIEPAIVNNARQGMSHCVIHTGSFPLDSERENCDFANSIIARLNELGYTAEYSVIGETTGAGLVGYGFYIRWDV